MENTVVNTKDYSALIRDINLLLSHAGLTKRIRHIKELINIVSSMFVAIYEAFFQIELDGIEREPKRLEDYEKNAQVVIDAVSQQIQMDLSHISGEAIVRGDTKALSNLSNIFLRIINITKNKGVLNGNVAIQELIANEDYSSLMNLHGEMPLNKKADADVAVDVSTDGEIRVQEGDVTGESNGSILSISAPLFSFNDADAIDELSGNVDDELSDGEGDDITSSDIEEYFIKQGAHWMPINFQSLKYSKKYLKSILSSEIQQEILRFQKQLNIEKKIELARIRRERTLHMNISKTQIKNKSKDKLSLDISQRKWMDELESEERSFQLSKSHKDTVALRKIYQQYLKKCKKWKIEEQREVSDEIQKMKMCSRNELQNLKSMFEKRKVIIKNRNNSLKHGESNKTYKEVHNLFKEMLIEEKSKALLLLRQSVQQDRERQLIQQQLAHQDILEGIVGDCEWWSRK